MENQEINMAEELQQLREQYASLKEEISKQNTINEKVVLSSIKKELRVIDSKKWVSLVACLVAIPLIIAVSLNLDFSLGFIIGSVAWLLLMHVGNMVRNSMVDIDSLSSSSVRSFVEEVKKRKKTQFKWVKINYSLFIVWVGCFIGELFRTGMDKEMLLPMIGGIFVGAVIGTTIGFRIHNRIIGAYEGIIQELENR